jgi:hypothetical protein
LPMFFPHCCHRHYHFALFFLHVFSIFRFSFCICSCLKPLHSIVFIIVWYFLFSLSWFNSRSYNQCNMKWCAADSSSTVAFRFTVSCILLKLFTCLSLSGFHHESGACHAHVCYNRPVLHFYKFFFQLVRFQILSLKLMLPIDAPL